MSSSHEGRVMRSFGVSFVVNLFLAIAETIELTLMWLNFTATESNGIYSACFPPFRNRSDVTSPDPCYLSSSQWQISPCKSQLKSNNTYFGLWHSWRLSEPSRDKTLDPHAVMRCNVICILQPRRAHNNETNWFVCRAMVGKMQSGYDTVYVSHRTLIIRP